MLRVLCLTLLAAASVAHAGEHYREVWNPPETRHALHTSHPAHHKPAAVRLSAKRSTKIKPSRVVACVPAPIKRGHTGRAVRMNSALRMQNPPAQLATQSHVLSVDSNGVRPQVVR